MMIASVYLCPLTPTLVTLVKFQGRSCIGKVNQKVVFLFASFCLIKETYYVYMDNVLYVNAFGESGGQTFKGDN